MTDTDKLKRLAERMAKPEIWQSFPCPEGDFEIRRDPFDAYQAILALIAENEQLSVYLVEWEIDYRMAKSERDEAVALLRESSAMHKDMHEVISGFLSRIDAAKNA